MNKIKFGNLENIHYFIRNLAHINDGAMEPIRDSHKSGDIKDSTIKNFA